MLKRMCDDHPEVLKRLREEVTGEAGDNQHTKVNDNIIDHDTEQGTSKDYTLDRLAREDPALYEKVVADEMSANAAA